MSLDLTASGAQFLVSSAALLHGIATWNYTQSVWIKRRTAGASFQTVMSLGGSAYQALLLTRNSSANVFSTYFTAAATAAFNSAVPTGEWVHLAITRYLGTVTGYVNGVAEVTTHTNSETVPEAAIAVGSSRASVGGDYFDGLVNSVTIWNAALNAGQVARLAAGESPLVIGGEFACFPLDDQQGPVVDGQNGLRGLGDISGTLVVGGGSPVWSADSPMGRSAGGRLRRMVLLA